MQTVEARENYYNRSLGAIKAGGNFIQTSFPNVAQLPTFAYSVKGSSNTTYTSYTVRPCLISTHRFSEGSSLLPTLSRGHPTPHAPATQYATVYSKVIPSMMPVRQSNSLGHRPSTLRVARNDYHLQAVVRKAGPFCVPVFDIRSNVQHCTIGCL